MVTLFLFCSTVYFQLFGLSVGLWCSLLRIEVSTSSFQVREARVLSFSLFWPVLESTWCLYGLYVAVNIGDALCYIWI